MLFDFAPTIQGDFIIIIFCNFAENRYNINCKFSYTLAPKKGLLTDHIPGTCPIYKERHAGCVAHVGP